MSPQEHYFENILFSFKNGQSYDEAVVDKSNTQWLTIEEINAIQTCALYVINNICDWSKDKMEHILAL